MSDEDKTPASGPMLSRFTGPDGRTLLLQVIEEESILRGLPEFESLVDKCEVMEIAAGTEIIKQGDADNDIYIIISGTFHTHVNGRLQAERRAGQHVGEVAQWSLVAVCQKEINKSRLRVQSPRSSLGVRPKLYHLLKKSKLFSIMILLTSKSGPMACSTYRRHPLKTFQA